MSYKWRCTGEVKNSSISWYYFYRKADTFVCFSVIQFNRCVCVQGCGCVCGIGSGDGSVSDCRGGRQDATSNKGMRWSNDLFTSCLLQLKRIKKIYISYS